MAIKSILCSCVLTIALLGVAGAEDINPVVGKTADFVLRSADLDRLISEQPADIQKKLQDEPEQRVSLVRQILTQHAVATRARKEGFDKKPAIREQLGYLIERYIAQEYLLKEVAARVTIQEPEIKKFFNENGGKFLIPEQVKVRHIFFEATKDMKPDDENKVRSRGEATLQRLKKGEDFAKLARDLSEDSDTGKNGGELGTLSPGSTSSEDFEKVAFSIKAGELSGLVKTPYGYHIIRVDERTEKRPAKYEEVREQIRKNLHHEAERVQVQEFIDRVTKEAGLELFTEKMGVETKKGSEHDNQK